MLTVGTILQLETELLWWQEIPQVSSFLSFTLICQKAAETQTCENCTSFRVLFICPHSSACPSHGFRPDGFFLFRLLFFSCLENEPDRWNVSQIRFQPVHFFGDLSRTSIWESAHIQCLKSPFKKGERKAWKVIGRSFSLSHPQQTNQNSFYIHNNSYWWQGSPPRTRHCDLLCCSTTWCLT